MEKINELRDEVFKIAVAHGWHEKKLTDQHYLMLIICELAEAIEADRKDFHAAVKEFKDNIDGALRELHLFGNKFEKFHKDAFETFIKDSVEDELADVVIRCLDLAGLLNLDMELDFCKDWDTYRGIRKEEYFKDKPLTIFAYDLIVEMRLSYRDVNRWILIYVIELIDAYCKYHGIDLEWHVKEKVKYNRGREYKHGKKY